MKSIVILSAIATALGIACSSKAPEPQQAAEPAAETTPRLAAAKLPASPEKLAAETNAAVVAKRSSGSQQSLHQQAKAAAARASAAADSEPAAPEAAAAEEVAVNEADLPQEGDELLIPPKLLGKLLPGGNFDKVEREEPVKVPNALELLEARGIVLTNYQQLAELGITNYTVVRAKKPDETKTAQ